MARRIALTFTESRTTAFADLLDRQAPETSEAIWGALARPAVNRVIHAMYVGREVMLVLPPENQTFDPLALPPENQTILPLAGEICFGYYRPHELNAGGGETPQDESLFDVAIIYGRNARLFSTQGWLRFNVFATITENLAAFAAMCARVRTEGLKEVRIERDK
jgi:hypothetical protein